MLYTVRWIYNGTKCHVCTEDPVTANILYSKFIDNKCRVWTAEGIELDPERGLLYVKE